MSIFAAPRFATNPYVSAHRRSQFKERLRLAQGGQLVPHDHVKTIQRDPSLDLFEIRWCLPANPIDPASGQYLDQIDVHVRMYHLEEGALWFLGVHIHEKVISDEGDEATRAAQNEHVDASIAYIRSGEA